MGGGGHVREKCLCVHSALLIGIKICHLGKGEVYAILLREEERFNDVIKVKIKWNFLDTQMRNVEVYSGSENKHSQQNQSNTLKAAQMKIY